MSTWSGIGDGKRSLRIGQRRKIARKIAGVTLDTTAGFAAMQRAIFLNALAEDCRFRELEAREHARLARGTRAKERCAEAWAFLGLPVTQVRVRWDVAAWRLWCVVNTDARGEREVWSRNEVSVEALEALATWWAQQEVIP